MRLALISFAAILTLANGAQAASPNGVASDANSAMSPGHQRFKNPTGKGVESPRERERERGSALVQHPDESSTGR